MKKLPSFLAETLAKRYPRLLKKRYGIEEEAIDGAVALEAIALKRGCLRKGKGGALDLEKAARILLKEFRDGILGRISLESPDEMS